jgi:hypothetical protein
LWWNFFSEISWIFEVEKVNADALIDMKKTKEKEFLTTKAKKAHEGEIKPGKLTLCVPWCSRTEGSL